MTRRTNLAIGLRPANGTRFQPTGFPDIGAATFQLPAADDQWVEGLHVESPQSMANHLEDTTWDHAANDQASALAGLPYVRIVDTDGAFLSSSRLEAHRLASAYIMDGTIGGSSARDHLGGLFGLKDLGRLDHRLIASQVLRLDPISLIHGAFFAQKKWTRQPKIARALTCFIDATDIRPAHSGGVKTDDVQTRQVEGGGGAEAGYGMVPHQRTEYTAREITAHISIDHEQIASYGLSPAATDLLEAVVEYELAHTLRDGSMRLRTACELEVIDESALGAIPAPDDADERVATAIAAAADDLGPIVEVMWNPRKGAK